MRLHPFDTLLFLTLRLLKTLDRRHTGLEHFDPAKVRRILVVSSTAIGDTLLSTPAIRAVREEYPHARIIAHFNVKNMEIFGNNPHIDGIIPYHGGYRLFFRTILEFRRHRFDLALIFHGNEPQATPMAYLSGAPFIMKIPMAKQYGFLLSNRTNCFSDPWGHHAIEVRLKTAELAGCRSQDERMVLAVDPDDRRWATTFLSDSGIRPGDVLIGFQTGAATPQKTWPGESFIALGKRLLAMDGQIRLILTGSTGERHACERIAREIGERALSVAGIPTLKQLGALVEALTLLVTNDTGTMHMAIALQTPTVSLFCPTSHTGVGPVQDRELHTVVHRDKPCSPCRSKKCDDPFCMGLIPVDDVFEAVSGRLHAHRPV
jgi:ADP-heptose:LPS heptosyltransferase